MTAPTPKPKAARPAKRSDRPLELLPTDIEATLLNRMAAVEAFMAAVVDHLRNNGANLRAFEAAPSPSSMSMASTRAVIPAIRVLERHVSQLHNELRDAKAQPTTFQTAGPLVINTTPTAVPVKRVVDRDAAGRITAVREVPAT